MTHQVYTLGYRGRSPDEIKRLVDHLDGMLFDIRFAPRSRDPRWAKKNIAAAVGPERYRHLKALGNPNYKGGPIEFVDFEEGLELIRQESRPVILMCACQDPAACHRTVAARRLRQAGFTVTELGQTPDEPPAPATQLQLF